MLRREKRRRVRLPSLRRLAAVASLLPWILAACAGPAERRGRVLLVGIDGASLRVARPLLAQGRLPHLAALASAGVYGPLRSHFPLLSPRIWNSIATGKRPEKHGVLDFAHPGPKGERRLYTSRDRRAHALWNIASDAGLRVGVVNWWTTYPLEVVNGVLVSDHLFAGEVEERRRVTGAREASGGAIAYPPEWQRRAEALLAEDGALTGVPDPFADARGFAPWMAPADLSRRYRDDQAVARIALAVERELRPDLLMVFLPGIDRVSHRLWATLEPPERYASPPPMTPAERETGRRALFAYYAFSDALIGRLAEGFGPDDLVMVVSDHGFEAGSQLLALTGIHSSPRARDGVIFARGPGVAAPDRRAPVSVNDVTPTILAWLELPLADDMDGRVAPFLAGEPVGRVATYDDSPVERLADRPSGAEEAILEQLEALGYLEHGGPG
jgi:predicted AlkP superfamily phosphohydrolase/phosphomutase